MSIEGPFARPKGLSIVFRDQALLPYLRPDGGEAPCPSFQRSLVGRTFVIDTEIVAIERLASAARSSWGARYVARSRLPLLLEAILSLRLAASSLRCSTHKSAPPLLAPQAPPSLRSRLEKER
jgi:hypothetical protein